MSFVDDIEIEPDEDGWHLILHTDDGERHDFRLGVPEQLAAAVARTITPWLEEGEEVRRLRAASRAAELYFRERDRCER